MNLIPLLQACSTGQVATGGQQQGGGGWSMLVMLVLIVVVFYFFLIRPQQKRQKEVEKKRNAMKVGDRVITAGGIHGIIREVKEKDFIIEITEGVRIRVDKSSVYNTVADAAENNTDRK